ncbi:MAG: MFS transporter, partial [Bacteroidales bacterium]|nr:MFS transporter [Bacteroidales bacterium]
YDRKQVLLGVITLSIIGSLVAGASDSLAGVVIGRTIQGSAGAILPLCVGILREHVDRKPLPIYLGVLTSIITVSAGLGILLGGVLVDYLTWHWIFFTSALAGVIAWLAVYFLIPPGITKQAEPGTNFLGGILFAPAIVCLLLAITKAPAWGWTDALTLALLAIGGVLLVAWGRSELNARVPLLNIRLLLHREILLVNIATILLGLTWMQFQQVWSILLQQPVSTGTGLGLSASLAGLVVQPQTAMALVGGPLAGWYFMRHGTRSSMALGALVLALAWFAAMLKHDSIAFIVLLMLVMGISSAFLFALLPVIVTRSAPEDRTSEAMGMMAVMRTTAMSIGAQLVAYLLNTSTVPSPDGGGNFPDDAAYRLAMGFIATGILLISVLYALFYRPPETRTASVTDDSARPANGTGLTDAGLN